MERAKGSRGRPGTTTLAPADASPPRERLRSLPQRPSIPRYGAAVRAVLGADARADGARGVRRRERQAARDARRAARGCTAGVGPAEDQSIDVPDVTGEGV